MLAILTSHPIQYQVPLWRALAADRRVPFEVWFLTPHGVQPAFDREFGRTFAWDEDLLSGYPHRFVPIADRWRIDRFRGVRENETWDRQLAERKITALWVEGWRFAAFWRAIRAARRLGLPVWLRGESSDQKPQPWHARLWKQPLLRRLLRAVHSFLVIGGANRRFYEKQGIPSNRLHPAPYSVDNDHWRRAAHRLLPERDAIRQAWGIAPDARCLLFAGKLIPKKRPLDLFAAARLLPPTTPPLHLLFVGEGEMRSAVSAAARTPGAPRCTMAGFLNLSQMPRSYAAADALVLPSDHGETWGLVVNEAIAAGVPCIVSDRCGCAEDLVAPVDPALVFRATEAGDLARAMHHLIERSPPADAWAARLQQHDIQVTVDTVAALWTETSSAQQNQ